MLWDVASGRKIGQMSGAAADTDGVSGSFFGTMFNHAAQLAWSPDGRRLAAGRDDGSILIYSVATRLPVAQIGYGKGPIRWLEWARDGSTVYGIVQNEASVRAWDVPKLARD